MFELPAEYSRPSGKEAKYPPNDDADNPLYKTDNFRMFCLKVLPCSKRYCHDWTTCPFAHAAEKAKRRDPRVYNYTGVACPEMKKNQLCPRGDQCPYAHNVFEYWLHQSRYRTQLCNDGAGCKRKICFFAHTLDELRVSSVKVQVPDGSRDSSNGCINPFAPSSSSPGPLQHSASSLLEHGNSRDLFDMDELQHFSALQARLAARSQQVAANPYNMSGMSDAAGLTAGMVGAGVHDQGAFDQLVRLLAMTNGQHAAASQNPMAEQQMLAAQMMIAQQAQQHAAAVAAAAAAQQQQAAAVHAAQQAAVMQAQQQVAALQLLNMQAAQAVAARAAFAAAGAGSQANIGMGDMAALQLSQSGVMSRPGSGNPVSALTAALGAADFNGAAFAHVDELSRQLSGLSTSSQVTTGGPLSPLGAASEGGPNSSRGFSTGAKRMAANGRPAIGSVPASVQLLSGNPANNSGMNAVDAAAVAKAAAAANAARSLPNGAGINTSPISIGALADCFTTTTGNSYFSTSHSLHSSTDAGSDDVETLRQ